MSRMEVLHDIVGYKNRKIYQNDDYFSFSLDSVLLANFVNIRMKDYNIVDLCTGNAVVPLILSLNTKKKIIGVELQKSVFKLAEKSIKYNNLDNQIEIINMNVKDFACGNNINNYDLIICNPPYFKVTNKSNLNISKEKMIARHEVELTLSDLCACAKKLLNNNGNFVIVHRADRFIEVVEEFRKNNIEPKRVRFVCEKTDKESNLFLMEGQLGGKVGLKIERPLILYNHDGSMTEEYSNIINGVE